MSQEKATAKTPSETRKKILLGVLFLVMIVVFYFQFFTGDDSGSRPLPAAGSTQVAGTLPSPTPRPLAPGQKPEPIISKPLEFAWFGKSVSSDGTGRNIFVYPTPTPLPPPTPAPQVPTPPPPPIRLDSVNPSGVIARTDAFPVTLRGDKFPPDAQGFLEGRPYESKLVGPTELTVQVPAEAIRNSGNLGVQVRSQADAALYSNQLSLNVAEPPPPPYRYIGLIIAKNGGMLASLKSQGDEGDLVTLKKGDKFGTHWRVVNITPDKIEVEDTNLPLAGGRYITHIIKFTGDSG